MNGMNLVEKVWKLRLWGRNVIEVLDWKAKSNGYSPGTRLSLRRSNLRSKYSCCVGLFEKDF